MRRHLLLYTALAVSVLATLSCKKDEETTETKPYIYGADFDLPTFARPGDTFVLTPYGAFTVEGDGVEKYVYKWKVNSGEYEEKETYTLKLMEVGNYTVYLQTCDPDENYYTSTTNKTVIVINPALGETLKGTGISFRNTHISDPRDVTGENEYYYTHIGDLDWFRNNLAWTGSGMAYENAEVTSYPLGRYYTWEEAMNACPDGWRLPTEEEWASLGDQAGALMCDAYLNDKRMWEYWPDVEKTNTTGMSVIPAGYALPAVTTPFFKRLYDYAAFWTATESARDSRMAAYRYIYVEENEVRSTYAEKGSLALSVRCVR